MKVSKGFRRISYCLAALAILAVVASAPFAQGPKSKSGTTLAASKTLDICDLGDGNWRYSGEISVWNEGAIDTLGLKIVDTVEQKPGSSTAWFEVCQALSQTGPEIPAGTTKLTATTFTYSCDASPAPDGATIRNRAKVTITNHSGQLGKDFGPEPKATYTGTIPPPSCDQVCGCSYTQGYWGNKPGVVWPAGFDRNAPFFTSGLTWQQILDEPAGGNGYIILAKQYIAAALNQANGACTPEGLFGVGGTFQLASAYFSSGATPALCSARGSCGLQKTWGEILDDYNNGVYPGGPAHCEDE